MVTDTAIALLRTGERIPLSDPLDEARRLFRDDQYDADVIGIEAVKEARAPPTGNDNASMSLVGPAPASPDRRSRTRQLAIAFDER